MPPSTSAINFASRRVIDCSRAPAFQMRRVNSSSSARLAASRTTTNTHGCAFSALGACVAASIFPAVQNLLLAALAVGLGSFLFLTSAFVALSPTAQERAAYREAGQLAIEEV